MPVESHSITGLLEENSDLRMRLAEADDTIRAIRVGEIDAFVIEGVTGTQIYTLQGLDAETTRMLGEMLAQVSDAVIAINEESRIIYLNAAAERLYGVSVVTALGLMLDSVYTTRWLNAGDESASLEELHRSGKWRGESIHIRKDRSEICVESTITRIREPGGHSVGRLAIIRDVTERKRDENRMAVSELRYRRLFEAAHDGVLIIDPGTRKIVDANPFMTHILGYTHDQLVGKELFEIGLLKDASASQEMFEELKRSTQVRYDDLPLKHLSGRQQEVEVVANLYDENGRPVIQCNIRDITERKAGEAHVKLLMAEVNHRANNLLAVVQAVALQATKYGDPDTLATRLSDRISGLAASQDLLVKSQWQGIVLTELVDAQLAHFTDLIGTRILKTGPPLRLSAAAAQGIGMALHELGTNAAKYGALSTLGGRIHIDWQITPGATPTFSMSWLEDGGPTVSMPNRKGFGQMVIGRMAEAAIDGTVSLAFRSSGLSWNLTGPAANVLATADARH